MSVNMGRFESMMNHFLREGFSGTVETRLRTALSKTTKLDIHKVEGGLSVIVRHDYNNIGKVMVSSEGMMRWLYSRTFK
jgi:hypothetical protein